MGHETDGARAELETMTYEQALAELDGIIERLERGAVALDEAIAAYERGARLAQHCAQLLDRTEQTISQLVVGSGGRVAEKPFTAEAVGAREAPDTAGSPMPRQTLAIDPDDIPF